MHVSTAFLAPGMSIQQHLTSFLSSPSSIYTSFVQGPPDAVLQKLFEHSSDITATTPSPVPPTYIELSTSHAPLL